MKFDLQRFFNKQEKNPRPKVYIQTENGQFKIMGMGAWYSYWRDPYHLFLTIPWTGFFLLISGFYLAINILFTCLYWLGGNCIANSKPGSFVDAFFFSVQTLTTIGYGAMYPNTLYANIIVTIEALIGVIGIALITGLAFARFSSPAARVMFSKVAVITQHQGMPTLMFRTANKRRNMMLEAQMRVYLMRDDITLEGEFIRKIYDLTLVRNQTPSFSLSWTVMHIIDESSPLYGMTPESLSQTHALLMVSMSGIDETVAQVLHTRHSYGASEILWNCQFVDILYHTADGYRYFDYTYFDDVVPLENV